MNRRGLLLLLVLAAVSMVIFQLTHSRKSVMQQPAWNERRLDHSPVALVTNQSIVELSKLLIADYRSTNEHDSISSALAHQLIAEQLQTNAAFLDWASNTTRSVILNFMEKGGLPVYGGAGLSTETLRLYEVKVNGLVGLYSKAVYDPNPTNEGPLEFIVEGGVHPTLLRVQNAYRTESYQLSPQYWDRRPRKLGRMDWSSATQPLANEEVNRLARQAFHEMPRLDLDSFHIPNPRVGTPQFLNPNAAHPEVSVTGNINAKLYSPKDNVYPFATFKYDDEDPTRSLLVSFSGEMVQTSPGHGEFVELFAVVRKTEAIFELGEKFLGQGTWEQAMLDHVHSLNTEQRGQIYHRIFQH